MEEYGGSIHWKSGRNSSHFKTPTHRTPESTHFQIKYQKKNNNKMESLSPNIQNATHNEWRRVLEMLFALVSLLFFFAFRVALHTH